MADSVRRAYGSGSIYRAGDRWVYAHWVREVDGRRRRRYIYGKSREDIERRLAFIARQRTTDRDVALFRRARSEQAVAQVLAAARAEGWDDERTAAVIVAQTAVRRIRLGVSGPCVYCGDWLARTVDHVIPRFHGGTDDPSNLVSACHSCNSEKRAKLLDVA